MLRKISGDVMQFVQQFLGYELRLNVFHAVDNPMSHSRDRLKRLLCFKPVQQKFHCSAVIRGVDSARVIERILRVVDHQIGACQSDAINLPVN